MASASKAKYLIVLLPFMVGACAAPVPIQVASWLIDGLSYLTTDKTLSDHGISVVMGRDCAMLRTVTEGELCRDEEKTAVAALDRTLGIPDGQQDARGVAGLDPTASALASFETAAGPSIGSLLPTPIDVQVAAVDATGVIDLTPVPMSAKTRADTGQTLLYYSLASFKTERQAQKVASSRPDVASSVMSAEVEGQTVFRVVVGPVKPTERSAVKRKIAAAGFQDSWAFTQVAEAR